MNATPAAVSLATPALTLLLKGLDESRALWQLGYPGHTRPVAHLANAHSASLTASRLMRAAQLGVLDAVPTEQAINALRELQCTDGSHLHGCFRWYAEETAPVDTNAAFFVGLNLILLARCYGEACPLEARETLHLMLHDLHVWFDHEAETHLAYYPNKFLGDLVCAWLLHEHLGTGDADKLLTAMDRAADYWLSTPWGWGEHLSDLYGAIMLNQLSPLLLLSRRLPAALREKYRQLFAQLVAIEDAFGGGPRAPAIRTYAFNGHPTHVPYRATIEPWTDQPERSAKLPPNEHFNFGHLFHSLGWLDLAGPATPRREHIEIPCYGGAVARAWTSSDARLGTLSRYPIMPDTDHPTWGLSWQTMPVLFAAGADGWGFLRWHTREGGVDRFHPTRDKRSAYLHNALTDTVTPPITGRTAALQDGPDALVLRRMPALSRAWDMLADQLVLTGTAFTVEAEESGDTVSRLLLRAGAVPVTVIYYSLGSGARPQLRKERSETLWEVVWPAETLKAQERTAGVWMFAWGRDVPLPAAPRQRDEWVRRIRLRNDEAWTCAWPCATPVDVVVDPLADEPLQVVEQ